MVVPLKDQTFISAVVYLHNSPRPLLNSFTSRLYTFLDERFYNFEIVLVNDGSHYDVKAFLKEDLQELSEKQISIINLTYKCGLETAIQVGVDFAIGDLVFEIDTIEAIDDILQLERLYKKALEGFDIVSLQPKKNRSNYSSVFYAILNNSFKNNINFKSQVAHVLTRRAINAISKIKDKTRYRKILHHYSGYTKAVIEFEPDTKTTSEATFNEKLKMSTDLIFLFTNLGHKFNTLLVVVFLCMSLFLGGYSIYQYVFNESVIEGWTSVMLFLAFGFSGVFLVLLIINKYFGLLFKEIRTHPNYLIKSIEKL